MFSHFNCRYTTRHINFAVIFITAMAVDNSLPYIIYFIVLVALFLLYLFVLWALLINRNVFPFNSSFFTIWIHLGINDCVFFLYARLFAYDVTGVDWIRLPVMKTSPMRFWVL